MLVSLSSVKQICYNLLTIKVIKTARRTCILRDNRYPRSIMMTSSNGKKIFRVAGLLWGKYHRRTVDSPHKSQWRRSLIFSLICAWTNGCANNRDACDLRRHCDHYNVTVMCQNGVFNPYCAGTVLFRYNTVNIMVADALTPCVGRTSVDMALIM